MGPDETGGKLSAPGSPNRQAGEYSNLIRQRASSMRPRLVRPQRLGPRPWCILGRDASGRGRFCGEPEVDARASAWLASGASDYVVVTTPSSSTEASSFDGEVTYGIASRGSASGWRGAMGRSRVGVMQEAALAYAKEKNAA